MNRSKSNIVTQPITTHRKRHPYFDRPAKLVQVWCLNCFNTLLVFPNMKNRTKYCDKICEMQYLDLCRNDNEYLKKEVLKKVIFEENGCWNWRNCNGIRKRATWVYKRKHHLATRIVYTIYKGEIQNGMHVLHTCDNPRCVNPDHLFLGTHRDNMQDKVNKNRAGKGRKLQYPNSIKRGEESLKSKITNSTVHTIRSMAKQGMNNVEIAQLLNTTKGIVSHVVRRKTWKHVPENT